MLESESLFVLQFPNRVEPLIRKGQAQSMNWKSLLQESEALFASSFGSQKLQVLSSCQREPDPWKWFEIRRQNLDWEPGECLNFERFSQQVQWVKQGIAQGHFEKLVLARCAASETQENRNLKELWEAMNLRHPQALRFAYYQPELGLWMGATPEHLLQWEKGQGRILAMAGTLKEGESWSPKEQLEQSVTGRFIEEVLAELGADFEVDALQETPYGELRHLRCEYRFGMERDQLPDLLERLNPTPAVAGYPQGEALQALEESVVFDRGAYAGVLGAWKNQSLQAWVQLRCARLSHNGTWLYAGAGVNAGSEARKEWDETQFKMESLGI